MRTIRAGLVKTRKDHNCWGCCKVLPKGADVFCCVTVDDGRPISAYWCGACRAVIAEHGREIDPWGDGYEYGSLAAEYPDLRAKHEAPVEEAPAT